MAFKPKQIKAVGRRPKIDKGDKVRKSLLKQMDSEAVAVNNNATVDIQMQKEKILNENQAAQDLDQNRSRLSVIEESNSHIVQADVHEAQASTSVEEPDNNLAIAQTEPQHNEDEMLLDTDGVEVSVNADEDDFDEVTSSSSSSSEESDEDSDEMESASQTSQSNSGVVMLNRRRNKFDKYRNDPEFQEMLWEMMDEKMKRQKKSIRGKHKRNKRCKETTTKTSTPKGREMARGRLIKSPSDTTLYTPALKKAVNGNRGLRTDNSLVGELPHQLMQLQVNNDYGTTQTSRNNDIIGKISDFVDQVRTDSRRWSSERGERTKYQTANNAERMDADDQAK